MTDPDTPRPRQTAADRARISRATRAIGLAVGAASAVVTALGAVLLILWVTFSAHPDGSRETRAVLRERAGRGDDLVVDTNRLVVAIIALGVIGIAVLGLVAWLVAKKAVRPLAEALQMQRDFVADASHELRTPLTILVSRIQVLGRRYGRGEPVDDVIARLRADADAMNEVLTDLLVSAEGAREPVEPVDVAAVAQRAADRLTGLAAEASIGITVVAEAHPRIAMPETTLSRCLVAVIDNAIQHSPDGTRVRILIETGTGMARIRVTNAGGGIRPEDAERIFARFTHGPESGRRRSFGLGLALVRDMVARYGGTIVLDTTAGRPSSDPGQNEQPPSGQSGQPGETTFLLRFPIAG